MSRERTRMDCNEFLSSIHDFIDGELPPHDASAAHRHLAACARCSQGHANALKLKQLVKAKVERPRAPAALPAVISAGLARAGQRSRKTLWLAAAAAAIAAAVAGTVLFRGAPEPKLGHTEASTACAEAFQRHLAAGGRGARLCDAWRERLLGEIRRATGVTLDRLPEIPGARFAGWDIVPIRRLECIRIDFRLPAGAPGASGEGAEDASVSVFYLPLERLALSAEYVRDLEEGHPCTRCIDLEDGTIYCFRSAEYLISAVANLAEGEFLDRHRPR